MNIYFVLSVIGWVACSVLIYGLLYARFSRGYPFIHKPDNKRDKRTCFLLASFGPLSLPIIIIDYKEFRRFGFLYRNMTEEEIEYWIDKVHGKDVLELYRWSKENE